ncbi:helix-turn-helix domain-containing protein [Pectinatus frisingensis]|uniref:helix-turn-helix domain-containing protein n=1 Tax=Pectinatus frisingensis TaxID=865 RepID=UPI0018C6E70C|nr:helix-turn-helix domain-containing protein [Pectinatus frisingensis]
MEKVTLTVPEMAEKLNIGKNKAYELAHQVPHVKIGKQIRIPVVQFNEWLINEAKKNVC